MAHGPGNAQENGCPRACPERSRRVSPLRPGKPRQPNDEATELGIGVFTTAQISWRGPARHSRRFRCQGISQYCCGSAVDCSIMSRRGLNSKGLLELLKMRAHTSTEAGERLSAQLIN